MRIQDNSIKSRQTSPRNEQKRRPEASLSWYGLDMSKAMIFINASISCKEVQTGLAGYVKAAQACLVVLHLFLRQFPYVPEVQGLLFSLGKKCVVGNRNAAGLSFPLRGKTP